MKLFQILFRDIILFEGTALQCKKQLRHIAHTELPYAVVEHEHILIDVLALTCVGAED